MSVLDMFTCEVKVAERVREMAVELTPSWVPQSTTHIYKQMFLL